MCFFFTVLCSCAQECEKQACNCWGPQSQARHLRSHCASPIDIPHLAVITAVIVIVIVIITTVIVTVIISVTITAFPKAQAA